ncbi:MAG: hypothetical protein LBF85_06815 [Tannerella sp.]|jgi:hypothetical protein|nr:hypothetical protein [Tannerella sp.]
MNKRLFMLLLCFSAVIIQASNDAVSVAEDLVSRQFPELKSKVRFEQIPDAENGHGLNPLNHLLSGV